MNRPWKILLTFLGVFLAGGVAGGFVSLRVAKSFVQKKAVQEDFSTSQMRRLTESLSLTAEQQQRIRPIVDTAGEELKQLRSAAGPVFQRMQAAIIAEISPEQRLKFEEMIKKWRKPKPPAPEVAPVVIPTKVPDAVKGSP